jgi:hypothetical protein
LGVVFGRRICTVDSPEAPGRELVCDQLAAMCDYDPATPEARDHLHRLVERWAGRHDAVVDVETYVGELDVVEVHVRFVNLGHVGFSFVGANGVEHRHMDPFVERCLDQALRDGDLRGDHEFWIHGMYEDFLRNGEAK